MLISQEKFGDGRIFLLISQFTVSMNIDLIHELVQFKYFEKFCFVPRETSVNLIFTSKKSEKISNIFSFLFWSEPLSYFRIFPEKIRSISDLDYRLPILSTVSTPISYN